MTNTEPTIEQFRKMIQGISDGLYGKIRKSIPHTVLQGRVIPETAYAGSGEKCQKCELEFKEHPGIWDDCYLGCDGIVYHQSSAPRAKS